jgi:uroporphyrin-III C-methyltransferase/precorrin-2 dehydrogenase/sirohydrochlorin ferrochelatase
MGWLPLFLDVRERNCLVVGGDAVAARKVDSLLRAGARVTIQAEHLGSELRRLLESGQVSWQPGPFSPALLDHVWLVISVLDDDRLNGVIKEEADRRRIFVNVVDRPKHCSAFWPAVVERPPLVAAIASGGQFPALSGWLRRKLSECLPERVDDLAAWLVPWRQVAAQWVPDLEVRGNLWRGLFDQGVAELFLEGRQSEAERMIRKALEDVDGR